MAKQVLAASVVLCQLPTALTAVVQTAQPTATQQSSHSDEAVASAQDCSHGSTHLPSAAPGAALFTGELTSSLPLSKGGVGLVHVPTQIQAWKVFQLHHLSRASQVQPLGYGASILFSTLNTDQLQFSARLSAHVIAFKALHPHRLQPATALLPSDILNEPLFFKRQICKPAASSATTDSACPSAEYLTAQQKPLMLSAGITKVAHLRLSLQLQQTQLLARELSSVLLVHPPAWHAIVSSAPASTWFQILSASGRQLFQDAQTGNLHTVSPRLQIAQTPPELITNSSPVQIVSWDPFRP